MSGLSLAEQGRCRKLELHVDVNGKPHSRLPVPWLSKLSGGSQQPVAAETFHEIVRAFQTLENAPAGHTALSDAWQKVTGIPIRTDHECCIHMVYHQLMSQAFHARGDRNNRAILSVN